MTSKEFWSIYNRNCRKNESANLSVKDHALSGDHGAFEIGVFQNEAGIWCLERTIERSNNSYRKEFATEEECFDSVLRKLEQRGWDIYRMGFLKKK